MRAFVSNYGEGSFSRGSLRRITIVGCPGSGKTTVATRLAASLRIKAYHLDRLWWQPGWVASDPAEFDRAVAAIVATDSWLVDGNYTTSLPERLRSSSLLIWLDLPRRTCMYRVLRRTLAGIGKSRPEMTADCPERIDPSFLRYVWSYGRKRAPIIERAAAERPASCDFVRLRSSKEAEMFIEEVSRVIKSGTQERAA